MPSYGKLKVAELRDLCDERGLQYAGLNKKRLIEALQNDNDSRLQSVIASDGAGLGAEAELGDGENGHADDSGSDDGSTVPSADETTEPESVAELKLQLALVQAKKEARIAEIQAKCDARREEWEIEKERMAMRASSQQSTAAVAMGLSLDSTAVGNLKLMLPSMQTTMLCRSFTRLNARLKLMILIGLDGLSFYRCNYRRKH